MDKINKPRGLIRYASPDEIEGNPVKKILQNQWIWICSSILLASGLGVVYGLAHMSSVTLNVRPERQPLFVRMSDSSIQNRYEFKLMNKTTKDMQVIVTAEGGIKDQLIIGSEKPIFVPHDRGASFTVFVKAPSQNIAKAVIPIRFHVESLNNPAIAADYNTQFNGP